MPPIRLLENRTTFGAADRFFTIYQNSAPKKANYSSTVRIYDL